MTEARWGFARGRLSNFPTKIFHYFPENGSTSLCGQRDYNMRITDPKSWDARNFCKTCLKMEAKGKTK